jgi:hypothetical protein
MKKIMSEWSRNLVVELKYNENFKFIKDKFAKIITKNNINNLNNRNKLD